MPKTTKDTKNIEEYGRSMTLHQEAPKIAPKTQEWEKRFDRLPETNMTTKEFIASELERVRRESYDNGYKRGVQDEIECVETSGEHLDLIRRLIPKK